MKIGETEVVTALPDDLDGKVRALTGYAAAPMHDLLAEGHVLAGTVARALHPFLAEAEDLADLAQRIADAGVRTVQADVVKLYAEALGGAGFQAAAAGDEEEGEADGETDD